MNATVLYPPKPHAGYPRKVFLAGSIDMGIAEDWQAKVIAALQDLPITLLNPRRPEWDASWEQRMDNPQFNEQVNWELDGLETAELILLYLGPGTKSPVSMLEFGLHAKGKRLLVCCPEGFWRKGNIDIVCHRESIPQFDNLDALIAGAKEVLTS